MKKKDENLQHNVIDNIYPPVVSVLGHVDHGKTTLLDSIRKTGVALKETGGITQKIGASEIEINHDSKKRKITFIDTPGHEAFADMRARGVSACDIGILVVAADDGVMPQTRESIQKLLEAKIPFIVAITKIDMPGANIDKVKQQLLKEDVRLEGYNGDVPCIAVCAKTGEKIQDLLDLILLVYDLGQIKKDEKENFYGIVIESKLDRRRGILVTIVVKSGKISGGDKLFTDDKEIGKARALINTQGKKIASAFPGDAVEIIGAKEVISTGMIIFNQQPKRAIFTEKNIEIAAPQPKDLKSFFAEEAQKNLKIILKTEGKGELDAIKQALPARIEIIYEGLGDISVSDVLMAKDFRAIIVGFNNNITSDAKTLAENESIFFKIYRIIYNLLDEITEAVNELMKQEQEVILGRASIIAAFEGKDTKILGVRVNEGRIALNDKIRILRDKKELGISYITSLKKGRQAVKDVGKGTECGVQISPFIDFRPGDMLLSYR